MAKRLEDDRGDDAAAPVPTPPDWLERTFSWLSGALVLALLASLAWDAAHDDRPAAFRVSVGPPAAVGSAVHVPVTVHNTGERAAQGLEVTVTLVRAGGGEAPEASFTLDWLAGRSSRRGVAVFPRAEAAGARATAAVTGFAEP